MLGVMNKRQKINKGLSVFVLAFLCLNVGGALCLTMCTQLFAFEVVAADDSHLSEHCRKAKKAAEEHERNSTKIEASVGSCCMLPVGLFAAPLEKRAELKAVPTVAAIPAAYEYGFAAPANFISNVRVTPVYRPPPLDRRGERILHSVIRI